MSKLWRFFVNLFLWKDEEESPYRGQYLRPKCIPKGHSATNKWRKVTLVGALPLIFLIAAFVFSRDSEKERPPFVKYDYMRIRRKRFPWGDGQRTFFHNPDVNALPEGYEGTGREGRDESDI